MEHRDKQLCITYRRNGERFTVYVYNAAEAIAGIVEHPYFPGTDNVGIDSWDWLKTKLGSLGDANALPCLWAVTNGDWRLHIVCNDA